MLIILMCLRVGKNGLDVHLFAIRLSGNCHQFHVVTGTRLICLDGIGRWVDYKSNGRFH